MNRWLLKRFEALPARRIEDDLHQVAGTMRDYGQLSEHHYRARRPATATRVITLRYGRRSVVGRYVGRRMQPRGGGAGRIDAGAVLPHARLGPESPLRIDRRRVSAQRTDQSRASLH